MHFSSEVQRWLSGLRVRWNTRGLRKALFDREPHLESLRRTMTLYASAAKDGPSADGRPILLSAYVKQLEDHRDAAKSFREYLLWCHLLWMATGHILVANPKRKHPDEDLVPGLKFELQRCFGADGVRFVDEMVEYRRRLGETYRGSPEKTRQAMAWLPLPVAA